MIRGLLGGITTSNLKLYYTAIVVKNHNVYIKTDTLINSIELKTHQYINTSKKTSFLKSNKYKVSKTNQPKQKVLS